MMGWLVGFGPTRLMGFKNVLFEWHGMQIAPPSSLFPGNKFRFSFLHSLWLVRYVVFAFATFLTHARGAEKGQLIIMLCQNGMDRNAKQTRPAPRETTLLVDRALVGREASDGESSSADQSALKYFPRL